MISCNSSDQISDQPSIVHNITYEIDFPNITFNWDKSKNADGDSIKYLVSILNWTNVGSNNDFILDVYPKDPTYETKDNSLTISLSDIGADKNSMKKLRIVVYSVEEEFNNYSLLYSEVGYFGGDYFLDNYLDFVPLEKGIHNGNIILNDQAYLNMLENHQIHTLNGDLIINTYCTTEQYRPYSIESLKNLKGLKTINGNLIIGLEAGYGSTINQELAENYNCHKLLNNFDFLNLDGVQDLEFIKGDLLIATTYITNLNDFENLREVEGRMGFYNNGNLTNFCILSDLFKQDNFELYNNAYNPKLNDFISNNCSN